MDMLRPLMRRQREDQEETWLQKQLTPLLSFKTIWSDRDCKQRGNSEGGGLQCLLTTDGVILDISLRGSTPDDELLAVGYWQCCLLRQLTCFTWQHCVCTHQLSCFQAPKNSTPILSFWCLKISTTSLANFFQKDFFLLFFLICYPSITYLKTNCTARAEFLFWNVLVKLRTDCEGHGKLFVDFTWLLHCNGS